jgi:hypothetical protein
MSGSSHNDDVHLQPLWRVGRWEYKGGARCITLGGLNWHMVTAPSQQQPGMGLPHQQTAILIHQFLEALGLIRCDITLSLSVQQRA